MKRKAAAKVLSGSKSTQIYEHAGDVFESRVQRVRKWADESFTVDGEKTFTGEEENGVVPWKMTSWDEEGWLVQTGATHEGSTITRIGLLSANR